MKFLPDQYRLILDSLAEGVCTVGRDWSITSLNRKATELTGVGAEEAVGRSFGELFQCEVCECATLLSEVMRTGKALRNVATRLRHRGGGSVLILGPSGPARSCWPAPCTAPARAKGARAGARHRTQDSGPKTPDIPKKSLWFHFKKPQPEPMHIALVWQLQ